MIKIGLKRIDNGGAYFEALGEKKHFQELPYFIFLLDETVLNVSGCFSASYFSDPSTIAQYLISELSKPNKGHFTCSLMLFKSVSSLCCAQDDAVLSD